MATNKQIEANRRNAAKSTGPKTEVGKQTSKANAWKHGLAAKNMLYSPMRHEDHNAFHEMRNDLMQSWQPAGLKEEQLVDMIASAYAACSVSRRSSPATWTEHSPPCSAASASPT